MPFSTAGMNCARDRAAEDVVDELELAAARQRLHPDLAVAELAVAAGLLLVAAVRLDARRDRFPIRDARRLEQHFDAETPLQFRDRHLDVQLALAGEQQFVGLRIAVVVDGAVLFLQPMHRRADLVFVAAALRLDRVGEHRFGKRDRREGNAGGLVGDGVVGPRVLELGDCAEVAGFELRHVGRRSCPAARSGGRGVPACPAWRYSPLNRP